MERNIKSIIGHHLRAKDGEIGEVNEFYFDDQSWKIRYLVVKTGNSLSGREVLIAPDALIKTIWQNGLFPVNLTMEQIRNSPDISTDKPVSRQQEIELYGHYGWPEYWAGGLHTDHNLDVITPISVTDEKTPKEIHAPKKHKPDLYLCSTARVTDYQIYAKDGEIGHINDFIFNDQTWQLIYLVVNTQNWTGGKKVLIAVQYIKEIVWTKFEVFLDLSIAGVKNATLFKASKYKVKETKIPLPVIPIEIH